LCVLQNHDWMTCYCQFPLPLEEVNCDLVTVTSDDLENVVKHVPKIVTLVSSAFISQYKYAAHRFDKYISLPNINFTVFLANYSSKD
jgi:hypothetical protein